MSVRRLLIVFLSLSALAAAGFGSGILNFPLSSSTSAAPRIDPATLPSIPEVVAAGQAQALKRAAASRKAAQVATRASQPASSAAEAPAAPAANRANKGLAGPSVAPPLSAAAPTTTATQPAPAQTQASAVRSQPQAGSRGRQSAARQPLAPTIRTTTTPAPQQGAGETPTTTSATPPPPPVVTISAVTLTSVGPFSARLSWQTSLPAASQAAFGVDSPALWAAADQGQEHTATLSGLYPGLSYQTRIYAVDQWGRMAQVDGPSFSTEPLPQSPSVSAQGGALRLDGAPFFFTTAWQPCAWDLDLLWQEGLNLIQGGCPDDQVSGQEMLNRVAGHALYLRPAGSRAQGPRLAGEFLPDEWDVHLSANVTLAQLVAAANPDRSELQFVGLSNHVWRGAALLPQGRSVYGPLFQLADVVGSDLYPLQSICQRSLAPMFDGARDIAAQLGAKPTYQWVETQVMDCGPGAANGLAPTAQTVSAESWLAAAGGASGVGFFPANDGNSPSIAAAIAQTTHELYALQPMLFAAPGQASSSNDAIKVAARVLNGALYLVVVNSSFQAQTATIAAPALNGRPLALLLGHGSPITASGGFSDSFAPLEVRVYAAAPQLG